MRKNLTSVNVTVTYQVDDNGNIFPLSITWKDGRSWNIQRVLHTCQSPDMSFKGIRYTILIDGEEKYLYRDNLHWYVLVPI